MLVRFFQITHIFFLEPVGIMRYLSLLEILEIHDNIAEVSGGAR